MKKRMLDPRAIISTADYKRIKQHADETAKAKCAMGAILLNCHLAMLQQLEDDKRITYVAVWRLYKYGIEYFTETKKENPDVLGMLPKSIRPIYKEMISVLYLYALEYRKACKRHRLNTPKDIPEEFWETAKVKAAVVETEIANTNNKETK